MEGVIVILSRTVKSMTQLNIFEHNDNVYTIIAAKPQILCTDNMQCVYV